MEGSRPRIPLLAPSFFLRLLWPAMSRRSMLTLECIQYWCISPMARVRAIVRVIVRVLLFLISLFKNRVSVQTLDWSIDSCQWVLVQSSWQMFFRLNAFDLFDVRFLNKDATIGRSRPSILVFDISLLEQKSFALAIVMQANSSFLNLIFCFFSFHLCFLIRN